MTMTMTSQNGLLHRIQRLRLKGLRSSLVPIGVPRRYHIPFIVLRCLALIPAIYGIVTNIMAAKHVHDRDARQLLEFRSTKTDFYLAALWAGFSGFWSFSLANGLMRRWLYHYDILPAMVRLISLQAICWPCYALVVSKVGPDRPLFAWMFAAMGFAVANMIRTYVTSNIKYDKLVSPSVGGSSGLTPPRKLTWKDVVRGAIVPICLASTFTMLLLLRQHYNFLYSGLLPSTPFRLDYHLPFPSSSAVSTDAQLKVLILVTSSWTVKSFQNREMFRQTTLRLVPPSSNDIIFEYRFYIGDAPSPSALTSMGPQIEAESTKYQDMLVVPAPDTYNDLTRKMYRAMTWADQYSFDYVVKTDDDVFVRWDTVAKELVTQGRRRAYWRGLGYWNIPPIHDVNNKNAAFDYPLDMFPQFTAGAMYILSRDVVSLIVTPTHNRLFTRNEDQALGVWLFPYNIKPIHDRRIQQAHVCEDDMIAKHFSSSFEKDLDMRAMYDNVVKGRNMCQGFLQRYCALCYSCRGRSNHWRQWGFDCDTVKGLTLLKQPKSTVLGDSAAGLDGPIKEPIDSSLVMGSVDDPWLIPGVLSTHRSPLSTSADWNLLHWLLWTTDPDTFQERHYQALELVWINNPRAIVLVLSTTLPEDFFSSYVKHGFRIHVIPFSKKLIFEREWYLGPNSKAWLQDWDKWERQSQFFAYHIADYMRLLILYRYGGMYMDTDALWLRPPPDQNLEFIGSDYSSVESDSVWTLDEKTGLYLANGVMRFKRGWKIFREVAESAFNPATYSVDCFNCGGPRAVTMYVKQHRAGLEAAGFTLVPNNILYPYDYLHVQETMEAKERGYQEAVSDLRKLYASSWSLHLFGKMTNHLQVAQNSIVHHLFRTMTLDIPHPPGLLYQNGPRASISGSESTRLVTLQAPESYVYRETINTPGLPPTPKSAIANKKKEGVDLLEDEELTPEQFAARRARLIEELETPELRLSTGFTIEASLDGRWEGLESVFVRGGAASVSTATIKVRIETSDPDTRYGPGGRVGFGTAASSHGWASSLEINFGSSDAPDVTKKDINSLLATLVYRPPESFLRTLSSSFLSSSQLDTTTPIPASAMAAASNAMSRAASLGDDRVAVGERVTIEVSYGDGVRLHKQVEMAVGVVADEDA